MQITITTSRSALALSVVALLAAAGAGLLSVVAWAGPLTPPVGPVTGTYKTLSEVEPRTALSVVNTPGDTNSLFRITQPGSYYLTGNITGTLGKHGIEVAASNVSIDLMGFSLTGVALSADGITTDGVRDNLKVRNGTVTGWGSDGINLTTGGIGSSSLIESIIAASNGGIGIRISAGATLRGCVARANGSDGISVSSKGVLSDCLANTNGSRGIFVGSGGTLTNCVCDDNTSDGFSCSSAATIT
jgi:hypothetical protein